jgi:hypothetical protein
MERERRRRPGAKPQAKIPRFERAVRCLLAIQRGEAVGVVWMMEKLGLSRAQAKRDMLELETVLPVTRHKVVKNGRSFLMLAGRTR